jgi:uroporphyrinogen III methyltransferase/synthase
MEEIKSGQVDFITFTSSSTVSNFMNIIGWQNPEMINKQTKIACIGPITANTAREHGLKVDIVAEKYTIEGLVAALLQS